MVLFPPAKLNLGLHVIGKRNDGYHDLESIFLPTDWTDVLEVNRNDNIPEGKLQATYTGLDIPGEEASNLVTQAHRLLAEQFDLPGLSLHLHKVIPMGAGLGGGSADGTYTLRAINALCGLGLDRSELLDFAAQLGSDCPFFVDAVPALVQGRGEHVLPLPRQLPLQNQWILIANPGIHVATATAFSEVRPSPRSTSWDALNGTPIQHWDQIIGNDFERGVCAHHPRVKKLLQQLKDGGASYCQMTGSGSTVFGVFDSEVQARRLQQHLTCTTHCGPALVDMH